jgi:Ca-activated chloride channel family protein
VAGAEIEILETGQTLRSEGDGRYEIYVPLRLLSGDTVTLRARKAGYREVRLQVVVPRHEPSPTVERDIVLERITSRTDLAPEERARPMAPVLRQAAVAGRVGRVSGWPPYNPPPTDREGYAHFEENPFQSARAHPLSTFGIDVDRASYSNVRRLLMDSRWPEKGAVRIEEMINYFPYDYPEPGAGDAPFRVSTVVVAAPWKPAHKLLRIGLQAPGVETEDLPPANLVFLLDVSGSMGSADKLPLLKRAFSMLARELRPRDRVAIVVYAGASGVVLPSTPGSEQSAILGALERLQAGGSTAGASGIRKAYEVAAEHVGPGVNSRVILATDGDFNVGVSSESGLVELIEEKREEGIFLTVLGFGTGNLQDAKMEALADHGNGNYGYIDSMVEARKVLVSEMGGTLLTVAKDVKIQVEFNPAVVRGYRLLGYENRMLDAEDFADDRKDAGEIGAGHSVTALYEVVPVGADTDTEIREPGELRYQTRPPGEELTAEAGDDEIAFVKLRYKEPDGEVSKLLTVPVENDPRDLDADTRFASAVAAFGMLLRDSPHKGDVTFDMVWELASPVADDGAHRHGFLHLVEIARALHRSNPR